jgi:O-antigen ligase
VRRVSTAVPYLGAIGAAALLSRCMPYLVRDDVTVKGQPLAIVVLFALFPIAVGLWLLYPGSRSRSRALQAFLGSLLLLWIVHLALMIAHEDVFDHSVWLFPLVILMVWWKTPSWEDAWSGLVVIAWLLAVMLIGAWLLEVSGIVEPLPFPEGILEWQTRHYWLPLDGFMGVEGRWTGPFGHNTRTAAAAAYVFVVAVGRWRPSSVPLLLVGTFVLLITAVRASLLATLVAGLVLLLYGRRGLLSRVPVAGRAVVLVLMLVMGVVGMLAAGPGMTGRENIWPAFWEMVPAHPWLGVGQTGISAGEPIIANSMDAHNIFLDELVRDGIVGLVVLVAMVVLATAITATAAVRSFPGPAALLVVYLVTAQTDVQNNWNSPSFLALIVMLSVVCAGSWLAAHHRAPSLEEVAPGVPEGAPT